MTIVDYIMMMIEFEVNQWLSSYELCWGLVIVWLTVTQREEDRYVTLTRRRHEEETATLLTSVISLSFISTNNDGDTNVVRSSL
jgi:hypothetical protein